MLDKIGKALESNGIDLDKEYNDGASWNDWVERLKDEDEDWKPNVATGQEIYEKISSMLGKNAYQGNQKAASLALKDAGFVGVKVIAQRNTGGNKEGKMNYVIFDENNAQITSHTKFSLKDPFKMSDNEKKQERLLKSGGTRMLSNLSSSIQRLVMWRLMINLSKIHLLIDTDNQSWMPLLHYLMDLEMRCTLVQ